MAHESRLNILKTVRDGVSVPADVTEEDQNLLEPKRLDNKILDNGTTIRVYTSADELEGEAAQKFAGHYGVFTLVNEQIGMEVSVSMHTPVQLPDDVVDQRLKGRHYVTGGTRLFQYLTFDEAIADSEELGREMTFKSWSTIQEETDQYIGGSKVVVRMPFNPDLRAGLSDEQIQTRREILLMYADSLYQLNALLGGIITTGQDMNLTEEDVTMMVKYLDEKYGKDRLPLFNPDDFWGYSHPPTKTTSPAVWAGLVEAANMVFEADRAAIETGNLENKINEVLGNIILDDTQREKVSVRRPFVEVPEQISGLAVRLINHPELERAPYLGDEQTAVVDGKLTVTVHVNEVANSPASILNIVQNEFVLNGIDKELLGGFQDIDRSAFSNAVIGSVVTAGLLGGAVGYKLIIQDQVNLAASVAFHNEHSTSSEYGEPLEVIPLFGGGREYGVRRVDRVVDIDVQPQAGDILTIIFDEHILPGIKKIILEMGYQGTRYELDVPSTGMLEFEVPAGVAQTNGISSYRLEISGGNLYLGNDYTGKKSLYSPMVAVYLKNKDEAAGTDRATIDNTVGGINLAPDMMDMQIKRDGKGIALPLIQQPIGNLNIQGLMPVDINIQLVPNLPLLLGMEDSGKEPSHTTTKQSLGDMIESSRKVREIEPAEEISYLN